MGVVLDVVYFVIGFLSGAWAVIVCCALAALVDQRRAMKKATRLDLPRETPARRLAAVIRMSDHRRKS